MSQRSTPNDAIAKARACLDAYGADVARWPAEDRAAYGELAMGDGLKEAREAAHALDAMLNAATAPETPHDLKNRLVAGYHPPAEQKPGLLPELAGLLHRFGPAPAGAFATLAVVGFAIGVMNIDNGALTPEYEAYAYMQNAAWTAYDTEEGASWNAQ